MQVFFARKERKNKHASSAQMSSRSKIENEKTNYPKPTKLPLMKL